MSTGMTVPFIDSVAALYCLTNSMVWMPWGPRAVPTGGAGVALPAGNWIRTIAVTWRLAIRRSSCCRRGRALSPPRRSELRHLGELELYRCLPAEDVDQDLQLQLVLVYLGDSAAEVGERPLAHPHGLAHFVLQAGFGLLGSTNAV